MINLQPIPENMSLHKRASQQGAALVVALLILSLVVVLAASMTVEHNFSIRRVSNQLSMQQAYSWARGGESIALKALRIDSEEDNNNNESVDHRGEFWYSEDGNIFPLDEDGNFYGGRLVDLQGKFNLNSLRKPPAKPNPSGGPQVPYTVEQAVFMRLLQTFNDDDIQIDYSQAQEITEAVVDYLDADAVVRGFTCGEDDAYSSIDDREAHRTPNGPILSVTELRLVCNLPVFLYEKLRAHVTVWPLKGDSTININTASSELLRSIFLDSADVGKFKNAKQGQLPGIPEPVPLNSLKDLIDRLSADGYTDFSQVKTDVSDAELWPVDNLIGLHSDYFILYSEVKLNDLVLTLSTVISRENGTLQILARSTGGL
ncbi:MAG: type II secretion system minor pseudopilin GspK [Pseudomonadales bacterium]|nr:type II secretion system minor pseudopilin GspK [Pseudomonadales bacterium]